MDSENVKQIIIAYYAIKDACDAIVKPIRIELHDTESVAKMPEAYKDTLECLEIGCDVIQDALSDMEDNVRFLEKSIDDDGEVKDSNKLIADILFDNIPPKIKPIPNQPAMDDMDTIAKLAGYTYRT